MPKRPIRDVSLFVEVMGHESPLLLMHGGPGADHWTLAPFRRLADRHTLVFYDHRCNGRSTGAPVESMTWENLTADADALRRSLGFERWAVLGHSFGGHVALEYALRYPDSLSHLVLLDTGGDSRWSLQNAAEVLAERGFSPDRVELARRWFNGQVEPRRFFPTLLRLGKAYNPYQTLPQLAQGMIEGEWRTKLRPEALIFAARHILPGWTVMDRLGEITVPTLVMAGRDDFIFPPEHQAELAAGIPDARLRIIERAGHNPHAERRDEVMEAIRDFLPVDPGVSTSRAAVRDTRPWVAGVLTTLGVVAATVARRGRRGPAVAALASVAGVAGSLYTLLFRPRMSRWGASDEEVRKMLPGDELPSPMGDREVSTRAITIDAPPEEVWPWLVQMGSGRAGFYTHEWLERWFLITYADGHSSTRIHPEWQELKVGERVPYSRVNTVPVVLLDAPKAYWAGEHLVLQPLDGGRRTRLIARTRGGWLEPFARKVPVVWPLLWPLAAFIDRVPAELLHHYMETGMLKGIKTRVETAHRAAAQVSPVAA